MDDPCSVCAGTAPQASDKSCTCKGVGTAAAELQGFREELYKSHLRENALDAVLQRWWRLWNQDVITSRVSCEDLLEKTRKALDMETPDADSSA